MNSLPCGGASIWRPGCLPPAASARARDDIHTRFPRMCTPAVSPGAAARGGVDLASQSAGDHNSALRRIVGEGTEEFVRRAATRVSEVGPKTKRGGAFPAAADGMHIC